jgi:peptide/nickel transport system permease protein
MTGVTKSLQGRAAVSLTAKRAARAGGRVLGAIAQLVAVSLVILSAVFVLIRLSGDPAAVIAGPQASPEIVESIRESLGLNRPVGEQYIEFISNAARLDFGESFSFRKPALEVVTSRINASLRLAGAAALFGFGVGIPMGLVLAYSRPTSLVNRLVGGLATLGQTMPTFAIGILLILVFSVYFKLLPSFGSESTAAIILPSITLGAYLMARQARLVASYTTAENKLLYVESLEAQGYSRGRIRYRYVMRNVSLPVLSLLGMDLGQFFAGAVVVEVVFAWPGLGRLLVESVQARDYPLLQAIVLVFSLGVVAINFVTDRFAAALDPRVRRG